MYSWKCLKVLACCSIYGIYVGESWCNSILMGTFCARCFAMGFIYNFCVDFHFMCNLFQALFLVCGKSLKTEKLKMVLDELCSYWFCVQISSDNGRMSSFGWVPRFLYSYDLKINLAWRWRWRIQALNSLKFLPSCVFMRLYARFTEDVTKEINLNLPEAIF